MTPQLLLQTSVPAAVIALLALWRSHRVERRNLVLKLHEQLVSPEQQLGRRLLHLHADDDDWWQLNDHDSAADRDKINASLALFDIVGWHVERGYVKADDVLDLWAAPVVRCWRRAYGPYISLRREREGFDGWVYFEQLEKQAAKYLLSHGREGAISSLTR